MMELDKVDDYEKWQMKMKHHKAGHGVDSHAWMRVKGVKSQGASAEGQGLVLPQKWPTKNAGVRVTCRVRLTAAAPEGEGPVLPQKLCVTIENPELLRRRGRVDVILSRRESAGGLQKTRCHLDANDS